MKWFNTKPHGLHFDIDGVVYDVPVGGSCEIPDKLSYVITGRGLPMKSAEEIEADEEASKPKKAKAAQKEAAAPAPADEEASKPKKG